MKGRTSLAINQYVKSNNEYMKDFDKNKKYLYLNYGGINNLDEWTMSQKLPLGV